MSTMDINTNTVTDIAIVPEISYAAAIMDGMVFASEANLSESAYAVRRITWATGNNKMKAANNKTPLEDARGFILDKPNEDEMFPEDYELLDAMELLCEQGKAREVVIEHFDKSGNSNWVPSWQFMGVTSLFVVCEGVPGEQVMKNDPECRWGVVYAPYQERGPKGKPQTSEVRFLAFMQDLMNAGYNGPFAFKFSSYIAPKILACLQAHEYTIRFVNSLRAAAGDERKLGFYGCALPIQCSVNTLTAGSVDKDDAEKKDPEKRKGTKQVHYPIPAIPRLSRNDPHTAMQFLASVAITKDQKQVIEDNGRVQSTVQWSVECSKRLISGKVVDEAVVSGMPDDDTPWPTDEDMPESLR